MTYDHVTFILYYTTTINNKIYNRYLPIPVYNVFILYVVINL